MAQETSEPVSDRLVVMAAPLQDDPVQSEQQWIAQGMLLDRHTVSLADGLALAASANVTTNSRGETLVYLRNSGERQVAVYFDGAPINVPWDNRLDLALIPAQALNGIAVTNGPASVRYGINTAGGIVELIPASTDNSKETLLLSAQGGSASFADGSALWLKEAGPFSLTLAGGASERAGFPLPGDAGLNFQQDTDDIRLNTDREQWNALARLAFDVGGHSRFAASVLYINSEYGIAPASFEREDQGNPRFWRYPDSQHLVAIVNGHTLFGPDTELDSTVWLQDFDQDIESYGSEAYERVEDLQEDRDRVYGARAILTHHWGENTVRGVATGFATAHTQTDTSFPEDPAQAPEAATDVFRDYRISLGAEYERVWADGPSAIIGASGDALVPVETGGRPDSGAFYAWNVIGGVKVPVADTVTLSFSAGRKTRLPTPRELFGTAINRFFPNPSLKPEEVLLFETRAVLDLGWLRAEAVPFASFVSGTIDQRNIVVDGRSLRQRVNLRGSRVFGIEADAYVRITDELSFSGNVIATRARRLFEPDGLDANYLAERPNLIGRAALEYAHDSGLTGTVEIEHRGKAFSLTDENRFEPLSPATELNLQLSYTVYGRSSDNPVDLFVRVDNVTDTFVEPQFGLPAPGRWIRGGLTARLSLF